MKMNDTFQFSIWAKHRKIEYFPLLEQRKCLRNAGVPVNGHKFCTRMINDIVGEQSGQGLLAPEQQSPEITVSE